MSKKILHPSLTNINYLLDVRRLSDLTVFCSFLYLILVLMSCNSNQEQIQQHWIAQFDVHYQGTDNELRKSSGNQRIISFDGDSMTIRNFNFMSNKNQTDKIGYELIEDLLILSNKGKKDTIDIEFVEDQLLFKYSGDYPLQSYFKLLPRYHQAEKEKEFHKQLTMGTYKFDIDSFDIELEYYEDATFYRFWDLKVLTGDAHYWALVVYENELFLVENNSNGSIMHIKEFNKDSIVGVFYNEKNDATILKKVPPTQRLDINLLHGKWEEFHEIQIPDSTVNGSSNPPPPPPPPPPLPDHVKYYDNEVLEITENLMMQYQGLKQKSIIWRMNRLNDKMIFPKNWKSMRHWNIEILNRETLQIQRTVHSRDKGYYVESVIFKRIVR